VNELGLEDYVRGVVANELSPGGYPALEALKAQAVAARTYALRNRGQFMSQGFDVLPTTRSQVYRGLTSENPLSTRAVDETRGLVATYNGELINALYTSTCGGRTEDAENIFNQAVPYLRGRECAVEGKAAFTSFTIKTTREPADLRDDRNVPIARDVGLLAGDVLARAGGQAEQARELLRRGVTIGDGDGDVVDALDLDHGRKLEAGTGLAKKVRTLYQQPAHLKVECGRFVPIMRRRRCGL